MSVSFRCMTPFTSGSSVCSCESLRPWPVPAVPWVSFCQRAKPLLLEALRCGLHLILGKVWEPASAAGPQPCSGHSGSVWVAWLVVVLWSRTEIRWAEPVTSVMDLPSKSEPEDELTVGNSNTSSSSGRHKEDFWLFTNAYLLLCTLMLNASYIIILYLSSA